MGFFEFLIVVFPFLTAIIITLGVLWHKRRTMELKSSDTDIDVIDLNKKIDLLTDKIERLEQAIKDNKNT
ncbi:hypothetical protein ACERII_14505 [Evansella sp. AB-rgal1]|uniref:hypothetical protein n=1 Tax=Evansella sp. AB-rgal1 TaxID=3242696 RepID=UPI00359D26D0